MPGEIRETILNALYYQKFNLKELIEKLEGTKEEILLKAIERYSAEVVQIEASIRWIHEQREGK